MTRLTCLFCGWSVVVRTRWMWEFRTMLHERRRGFGHAVIWKRER